MKLESRTKIDWSTLLYWNIIMEFTGILPSILGSLHLRFTLTTAPPKYSKFATTLISILSIHCIWMLSIHILSYGYRKFFLIILLELKTWSWTETAFQSCFFKKTEFFFFWKLRSFRWENLKGEIKNRVRKNDSLEQGYV